MTLRRLVAALVILAASLALLVPGASALDASAPVDASLADRLYATLRTQRQELRVPGLVAAMRMPDGRTWLGAVGRAEVGGAFATPDTPWVIGSITKSFVAALGLKLQEEGVLSLDEPISTWLPDYPNGTAITLRMLLSHRSGIFDYFWHDQYEKLVFGRPTHHWTTDEILALTGAPLFPPGTAFSYSNTNYVLAGIILEQVGGATLAEQIRSRFLEPLGMTSTVFQGEEEPPPGGARGYLREDRDWIDQSDGTDYRPNTSAATVANAAGAMLSTARDLLRWEGALYGGEILSPDSMDQLTAFRSGYGLATRRQRLAGRPGLGHGGSLRGYVAVMYRLPDPGIDVIVFTNRGRVFLDPVADALVATVIGTRERPIVYPPGPVATPLPSATTIAPASPTPFPAPTP
jgi:D-alanyl-D-alanine carboxypeptidase